MMEMAEIQQSTILYLYSDRKHIKIDPEYQRMGDIWTIEKRQLLIDSILNGFDIPKIYFHKHSPPKIENDIQLNTLLSTENSGLRRSGSLLMATFRWPTISVLLMMNLTRSEP